MSIKGFKFDGVVHKYDYNSLDNIPDLNTETDKTLAIDGVPADAKATGDRISNLQSLVGSPLTASTAASMTDTNKVYVYTGSETGYTNGNWYYHDGTSWVSGGVYNSVAVDLDSTLTLANKAPDSKVVGDAIDSLNEDITNLDTQINGGTVLQPTVITLSTEDQISFVISPNTGKWAAQSSNRGYVLSLGDAEKVEITASDSYDCEYAFLASNSPVDGATAPIVGDSLPTTLTFGTSVEVNVPDGALYLYLRRLNINGYNVTPKNVTFYVPVPTSNSISARITALESGQSAITTASASDAGKYLKAKTIANGKVTEWEFDEGGEGVEGEITQLRTDVNALDAQINGGGSLQPIAKTSSDFTTIDFLISPNYGTWVSGSNRGQYVDLGDYCVKVDITAKSDQAAEIAFLSSYSNPVEGELAPIVGSALPTVITADESLSVDVPSGATVLYVRRLSTQGYTIFPDTVTFYHWVSSGNSVIAGLSDLESEIEEITKHMPFVYTLHNKTIAVTEGGTISDSDYVVLSDIFDAKVGTVQMPDHWLCRLIWYDDNGNMTGYTSFGTSATVSTAQKARFNAYYGYNRNVAIDAEIVTPFITENIGIPKTIINAASEEDLSDVVRRNTMNLNEVIYGNEDMIWTWWGYPQVVDFERVRHKLYWVYTSSDGYSGVASYDYDSGKVVKNHLKVAEVDDHNAPAVLVRSDGHIIVAYAGGHNKDRYIHIRHSSVRENIEHFGDEIKIEAYSVLCYVQMFEYGNDIYLFTRQDNKEWMYTISSDGGYTWSAWTVILKATMQYYLKIMPTTVPGVMRLVMYSNPFEPDPSIRMGFIHLDTGTIYNADNTTVLGTENVQYTSFTVIIPLVDSTSKPYQRMYDVALTAPEVTKVLYAQFSDDVSGDATYMLYDSGNSVSICDAGVPIWIPKYQCAISFINGTTLTPESVDISDFTLKNYFIGASSGRWTSGTNRGYYIDISGCKKIAITANSDYPAEYALLQNDTFEENSAAPIIGSTKPTAIATGTTVTVDVPSGASVLYIRRLSEQGYNITPSAFVFYSMQLSNDIVSIRNDDGSDIVELYSISNGIASMTKKIYEEPTGSLPIRSARPIVDINGKAFLWHRGYYNPSTFSDFTTDAKLYSFEEDEILL